MPTHNAPGCRNLQPARNIKTWPRLIRWSLGLGALFAAMAGLQCLEPVQTVDVNPVTGTQAKPRVRLSTTEGDIVLELFPDQAPLAVANFLRYVRDGFYDNTVVHEARANTSISAGVYNTSYAPKPTRDPIDNESSNGLSNLRGRVGMIEPDGTGTGTSAFLIHIADATSSDFDSSSSTPGMTVFGRVVEGMDIVETIGGVDTAGREDTKGNVLLHTPASNVVINAATVEISETTEGNNAPVANAGTDQTVQPNTLVTLDGSGSTDVDGDTVTVAWRQVAGPAVTLSRTDVLGPSFTPTQVGRFTFELTVTDPSGTSCTDSVDIVVSTPSNQPPVAEAGPLQATDAGETVTLDGSDSTDPDFQTLTYAWTQVSGTSVTLTNANTATPTFAAPSARGKLVFQLTVTDTLGGQATDTVPVVVTAVPAGAGADQNVLVKQLVTLHGTGETGATYSWSRVSGTAVTFSNSKVAEPSFTAPEDSGRLTFRVTVTSATGSVTTDDVNVDVYVETDSGLRYCDVVKGTGDVIKESSTIKALYTGRLTDQTGTIFDSTANRNNVASQFSLQQVIDGWREGLGNYDMKVNGKRLLIIPPDLAYGAAGQAPSIPGNATLWFEVEVTALVN